MALGLTNVGMAKAQAALAREAGGITPGLRPTQGHRRP